MSKLKLKRWLRFAIPCSKAAELSQVAEPQALLPPTPARRSRRGRVITLSVFALITAALVLATLREAKLVMGTPPSSWGEAGPLAAQTADCAIVLTGGPGRVREGFDLLSRKLALKLIVSGVRPQAELREIFPLWPFYGNVRPEDVVLERRSRTTFGNAQQSLPLVEALHCRDAWLVTSRAHMHRALATFRAEFPAGVRLYPRAVVAGTLEPSRNEIVVETVKSLFYSLWAF